ncbi:IPT/TIG domain-containing protein [Streptomyces violaceusniger]|uniref:Cell surface receptor IPT/TIG domain protein n=1 Tax=Streptomyces violaceusniger (strain Tu 4113) TaxID=653045 RepID=G2NSR2_STRV4|nr:IPT/TIG domain-containing protein [Streptomyces violaceusniger]AEM80800.1 cell surface receptor IPT/TIG domain protein [Streptomyces violaceusniger Tu 4113]
MPISPSQGSSAGGQTVNVTGVNLGSATAVHFGSKLATITANSASSVTVTSPSGSGVVPVTVTTAGGTSNPLNFYYIGAPFKSALSTVAGPLAGGNTVTITGTGLSTASAVHFGANTATPTIVSDSQITAVVPAGAAAGTVGVSVTTAGGSNNGFSYTYVDTPTVTGFTPSSGPPSGGTAVTITGTNLSTTQSVTFGGVAASFTVIGDTSLAAVSPPTGDGAPGPAEIAVTTLGGTAAAATQFQYVSGPNI